MHTQECPVVGSTQKCRGWSDAKILQSRMSAVCRKLRSIRLLMDTEAGAIRCAFLESGVMVCASRRSASSRSDDCTDHRSVLNVAEQKRIN